MVSIKKTISPPEAYTGRIFALYVRIENFQRLVSSSWRNFLRVKEIFQLTWSWFRLSNLSKFYPYYDLLISLEKIYDQPHPNPKNAIFLINLKWLIGSVSHILEKTSNRQKLKMEKPKNWHD